MLCVDDTLGWDVDVAAKYCVFVGYCVAAVLIILWQCLGCHCNVTVYIIVFLMRLPFPWFYSVHN